MRSEAIFLNGVFEDVLQDILIEQSKDPDAVTFLQPYAGDPIAKLRDDTPNATDIMQLLISTTQDLNTVRYAAEIVGWEDKANLSPARRKHLNEYFQNHQCREGFNSNRRSNGKLPRNLIHVRHMRKLKTPFSVGLLIKLSDNKPASPKRTRAGGWTNVKKHDPTS
jgi:hypothetical protein